MAAGGSTTIVLIAMGANFGIACAKFAAAAWTGSSAMLSEAIHSLVDTMNQVLLLIGITRAARPPDEKHPFGYSKELYFWSFAVAILLFSLGAGVSLYEGVEGFLHPHVIENADIIYIVLGLAIGLEGFSTYKALGELRKQHANTKLVSALKKSKDPALFAIVLEDVAAMIGLFVALIGVLIADKLGYHAADGIASIIIGLVLASVAVFMAIEIKGLIVGEAADPEVQKGLFQIIASEMEDDGPLLAINEIRTMHLGPTDILVAASIDFKDGIAAETVEATTHRLEQTIKSKFPHVRHLFLEVQSIASHQAGVKAAKANDHGGAHTAAKTDEARVAASDALEVSRGAKPVAAKKVRGNGASDTALSELPSSRKTRKSRRKAAKRKKKK